MADVNTIKSQIQTLTFSSTGVISTSTIQNTIAPLTNGVAGSTATAFSLFSGAVSGGGGGVIPLQVGTPGLYFGSGRKLKLSARGLCVTGTSTNLTLKLYQIPASVLATAGFYSGMAAVSPLSNQTFTGWNLVATSSARAVNTATGAWDFIAELQLTQAGTTGSLEGTFKDTINGIFDAEAAVTITTGLIGESDLNFVIVSTLSSANAGNTNYMTEFSIAPL